MKDRHWGKVSPLQIELHTENILSLKYYTVSFMSRLHFCHSFHCLDAKKLSLCAVLKQRLENVKQDFRPISENKAKGTKLPFILLHTDVVFQYHAAKSDPNRKATSASTHDKGQVYRILQ